MFNAKFLAGALAGGGVGYLLGARAGRERYEDIIGLAERATDGDGKLAQVAAKGEELLDRAKESIG